MRQLTISFLLLLLTSYANAEACDKWQYASLNYGTGSIIKDDTLVDVNTVVIWASQNDTLMWQNNKPISANTEKELAVYFGVNSVHPISILNALGAKGWEAYGYQSNNPTINEKSRIWQLKRCVQ
jgi:hypothetical protein